MKTKTIFLLAVFVAFAGLACAEYYTWEDESGAVNISSYPPPQNQKTRNLKVFEQDIGQVSGVPEKQPEKAPDITLYTKKDCADCDKARDFLKSRQLPFTEFNMDEDQQAVEKRKEIDDSTDVPFAVINRMQVYGFSEAVYNRALKSAP